MVRFPDPFVAEAPKPERIELNSGGPDNPVRFDLGDYLVWARSERHAEQLLPVLLADRLDEDKLERHELLREMARDGVALEGEKLRAPSPAEDCPPAAPPSPRFGERLRKVLVLCQKSGRPLSAAQVRALAAEIDADAEEVRGQLDRGLAEVHEVWAQEFADLRRQIEEAVRPIIQRDDAPAGIFLWARIEAALAEIFGERQVPQNGWQPINTAPEGVPVVVGWLENDDEENPERHAFDVKEPGGPWISWEEGVEHAEACAPPGSVMPSRTAPYTHRLPLPPLPRGDRPAAPCKGSPREWDHDWRGGPIEAGEAICCRCGVRIANTGERPAESPWRSLETAPRDETAVLVDFGRVGVHLVFWLDDAWCVTDNKDDPRPLRGWNESDVHGWMPVPAGRSDQASTKEQPERARVEDMPVLSIRPSLLREAVNAACSCGGAEPGKCCPACEVWHVVRLAIQPEAPRIFCSRCGTPLESGVCPATHLVTVYKEGCNPLLVPEDRLEDFATAGWSREEKPETAAEPTPFVQFNLSPVCSCPWTALPGTPETHLPGCPLKPEVFHG